MSSPVAGTTRPCGDEAQPRRIVRRDTRRGASGAARQLAAGAGLALGWPGRRARASRRRDGRADGPGSHGAADWLAPGLGEGASALRLRRRDERAVRVEALGLSGVELEGEARVPLRERQDATPDERRVRPRHRVEPGDHRREAARPAARRSGSAGTCRRTAGTAAGRLPWRPRCRRGTGSRCRRARGCGASSADRRCRRAHRPAGRSGRAARRVVVVAARRRAERVSLGPGHLVAGAHVVLGEPEPAARAGLRRRRRRGVELDRAGVGRLRRLDEGEPDHDRGNRDHDDADDRRAIALEERLLRARSGEHARVGRRDWIPMGCCCAAGAGVPGCPAGLLAHGSVMPRL